MNQARKHSESSQTEAEPPPTTGKDGIGDGILAVFVALALSLPDQMSSWVGTTVAALLGFVLAAIFLTPRSLKLTFSD